MTAIEVVVFALLPTLVLFLVLFSLRDALAGNWRMIIALAALAVLFFHRIVFFGEALSQSDANLLQLKYFTVYRDAVRDFAQIPFWNPREGAGVPSLASPISAMFYPLTPVFLFGNVFAAMNAFVVAHYFLAAVFALLFASRVFASRQAALAFAILYAFNGWAVTRAAHQPAVEYAFAYAWLPLVALFFERAVNGKNLYSAVAGMGAGLAWMGIASPNMFVYGALFLAGAFVLRSASLVAGGRRNAALFGFSAAVAALAFAFSLGATEYLAALELSRYSTVGRLGQRFLTDWRGATLSPWQVVSLYFPFVANRPFGVYYSPGIVALAAAAYGLRSALSTGRRRALALGCVAMLVFGAALLLGRGLHDAIARHSDVFARASLIPAALIFLVLPVVTLAATGVNALASVRRRPLPRLAWAVAALAFLELFVGLAVVYPRHGARRLTFDYRAEVADFPHLDYIAGQGEPGRILVISPEGEILAPSYATMPRGLSRLNLSETAFAPDWLVTAVRDAVTDPGRERLESLGVGWVVSTEPVAGLGTPVETPWPGVMSHFENGIHYAMRNAPGWLAWDKVVRLYRVSDMPAHVRGEPISRTSVLAARGVDPIESLKDAPVESFAAWDPVTTTVETANTLTAALPEAAPSRFFLAVTAYPGWRLSAAGAEVKYAFAGAAFMAADIPAGSGQLTAAFRSTDWRQGMWLAIGALIFAAYAAGRPAAAPEAPHNE